MKITGIVMNEMTIRSANLRGSMGSAYEHIKSTIEQYEHIADIDQWKVLTFKEGHIQRFVVMEDDILIGFFQLDPSTTIERAQLRNIFCNVTGKGMFAKVIWFLKTRLQYRSIALGDVHSTDTVETIKRIHGRFERVYWENDTGQQVDYDPANVGDFYGTTKKTEWQIVFEDQHAWDETWPMKNGPMLNNNMLKESYDAFCSVS